MAPSVKGPARATVASFLAIPDEERFHELIDGEIVRKASPSAEHGTTQLILGATLLGPFGRQPPSGGPGGWWLVTEVEIRFGDDICRPDVAGWRRSTVPERPRGRIVPVVPQWTCEVLSEDERNDLVRKKHIYHRHHVDHYWMLDPEQGTLAVYRWHSEGYLEVLSAQRGQVVRAEPFDAIDLEIGALFGDESSPGT
jgi:Uma2 family endonuclease